MITEIKANYAHGNTVVSIKFKDGTFVCTQIDHELDKKGLAKHMAEFTSFLIDEVERDAK